MKTEEQIRSRIHSCRGLAEEHWAMARDTEDAQDEDIYRRFADRQSRMADMLEWVLEEGS